MNSICKSHLFLAFFILSACGGKASETLLQAGVLSRPQPQEREPTTAAVKALAERMRNFYTRFFQEHKAAEQRIKEMVEENGAEEASEAYFVFREESKKRLEKELSIVSEEEAVFNAALASLFEERIESSDDVFYFFLQALTLKNIRAPLKKLMLVRLKEDATKFKVARAERIEKDPNNPLEKPHLVDPMVRHYPKLAFLLGADVFPVFKEMLDYEFEMNARGRIEIGTYELIEAIGATRDPRALSLLRGHFQAFLKAENAKDLAKIDYQTRRHYTAYISALGEHRSTEAQDLLMEIYSKARSHFFNGEKFGDDTSILDTYCLEALGTIENPSETTIKFVNNVLLSNGRVSFREVISAAETMVQFARNNKKLAGLCMASLYAAKAHYADLTIYSQDEVDRSDLFFNNLGTKLRSGRAR